jgi:flagellar biosynthesis chaperone FliJ
MNEKNTIEDLFGQLRESFDREVPPKGHRERFLDRLQGADQRTGGARQAGWWRPLSIAASIVILLGASFFFFRSQPSMEQQVAEIAPEASETTFYFASVVQQQVQQLEELGSPETQPMIDDTLRQLAQLEADYQKLEQDLIDGGNSKMILSAMITNFQTRIDLLQDVMTQIEQIKQFKNESDATHTI